MAGEVSISLTCDTGPFGWPLPWNSPQPNDGSAVGQGQPGAFPGTTIGSNSSGTGGYQANNTNYNWQLVADPIKPGYLWQTTCRSTDKATDGLFRILVTREYNEAIVDDSSNRSTDLSIGQEYWWFFELRWPNTNTMLDERIIEFHDPYHGNNGGPTAGGLYGTDLGLPNWLGGVIGFDLFRPQFITQADWDASFPGVTKPGTDQGAYFIFQLNYGNAYGTVLGQTNGSSNTIQGGLFWRRVLFRADNPSSNLNGRGYTFPFYVIVKMKLAIDNTGYISIWKDASGGLSPNISGSASPDFTYTGPTMKWVAAANGGTGNPYTNASNVTFNGQRIVPGEKPLKYYLLHGIYRTTAAPEQRNAMKFIKLLPVTGNSLADVLAAMGPVVESTPTNSILPAISGTAQDGQTLTFDRGTWGGNPQTYTYQVKRDGAAITDASGTFSGTTATYTVVTADVGHVITVTVTATNNAGSASATSNGTATVIAAAPDPQNTVAPAITSTTPGVFTQGMTLQSSTGTWSTTHGPLSYAYQWQRVDGTGAATDIAAATSSSYVLTSTDVGKFIRVKVTATNTLSATAVAFSTLTSLIAASTAPTTLYQQWITAPDGSLADTGCTATVNTSNTGATKNSLDATIASGADTGDTAIAYLDQAAKLPSSAQGRVRFHFKVTSATFNLVQNSTILLVQNAVKTPRDAYVGADGIIDLYIDSSERVACFTSTGLLTSGSINTVSSFVVQPNVDYTVEVAWLQDSYRKVWINDTLVINDTGLTGHTGTGTPAQLSFGIHHYDAASGDAGWAGTFWLLQVASDPATALVDPSSFTSTGGARIVGGTRTVGVARTVGGSRTVGQGGSA